MAKKKTKHQVTPNTQKVNLEIDYNKLAEAIIKLTNPKHTESNQKKVGFLKSILLIILNKEHKSGIATSTAMSVVLCVLFNILAIAGVFILIILGISIFTELNWANALITNVIQLVICIVCAFVVFALSLIFRAIANDINAEKDRNYISNIFFGFVSLASLIVAIVAILK